MVKSKIQVRKEALYNRSLLSDEERNEMNQMIFKNIIHCNEYKNTNIVLIYASYQNEADTFSLMKHALENEKEVYVPKVTGCDGTMEFFRISSISELKEGYKGIPEPDNSQSIFPVDTFFDSCLMIIPGVAFDKTGNRIGYGKGFYDRYLARCKVMSNMHKIAIAYDCQIYDSVPSDITDIKMERIITEKGEYLCT